MNPPRIFVAVPTYNGEMDARIYGSLKNLERHASVEVMFHSSSLLCLNFNRLYATALERRDNFDYFLLWHADIVPRGTDWPRVMIDTLEREKLFALSAIVPIKDDSDTTSTARLVNATQDIHKLNTPTERHTILSTDMDAEHTLLINTGLMLIDLRHPRVEDVCFTITDTITHFNGKHYARTFPEDWGLSVWMQKEGLKYGATSEVQVLHAGYKHWDSWAKIPATAT